MPAHDTAPPSRTAPDEAVASTPPSMAWAGDEPWPRDGADELQVNGAPLSRVVDAIGQTPCYVYDRSRLHRRVAALRSRLPSRVRVHYAVKANPMPALVCGMAGLIDGLDVASRGELRVALDAGMAAQDISFAGPGKSQQELRQAHAAGILVNLESFREIDLLDEICQDTGQPARVAVRVNLAFELKSSGMKMSGGARPFGIDAEQVPQALQRIAGTGLSFEGFHMFAGSQNLRAAAIVETQQKCYEQALEWSGLLPSPLRSLNLGGGFGIPYTPQETPLDIGPIMDNLAMLDERAASEFPGAHLVIELGRYLVGEAGLYVARVVDRKSSRGQVFLVTDGGMHHHLAASGNFGQVLRKNYPVCINAGRGEYERASVVGPLCTPLDLLADRAVLHQADVGDLVVVFQSGAYGRSASPRDFLGHPDVAEALV